MAGATVLCATALAGVTVPEAPAGAATASTPTQTLTVPTARHHGYRHGAVPRRTRDVRGVEALLAGSAASGSAGSSTRSRRKLLTYGGGVLAPGSGLSGAGVTTGQSKVYLVFMGSQWGTETVGGSGVATFGGDPDGLAPALQQLYNGLGTDGETWSGVMTQYCDGTAVGATTCSLGDAMIPHPVGGVLAGIWYDSSTPATAQETAGLTGSQLAAEAEAAATQFGNVDQVSNRDAQYVIVSPTGTDPDGWANPANGYCAYHDDSHDPTIDGAGPVSGPTVAFTNLPYVPDAGTSCGAGSVNSPGTLDGATEAASHEYAETLTDQFPEAKPPGGWTNASGAETGDLCAYVAAPAVGHVFDLTVATGTVAVQGTWSNRANAGKGACSDGEPDFAFAPVVASVSPASGAAGSTVTITGTYLGGVTAAAFAGTPATILAVTATTVTVTVPSGAADGPVTVTGPLGTGVSATVFHLAPSITSFAPLSAARGGTVTITGSGLGAAKKATVGGRRAVVTSDTATQIQITVPARAATGPIVVVTKYGTASGPTALTVS
jgi:serine protease